MAFGGLQEMWLTWCNDSRVTSDSVSSPCLSGYDWDDDGNLWVADSGRDDLDPGHIDRPDDSLLLLPAGSRGLNFGFPFCHWCNSQPLVTGVTLNLKPSHACLPPHLWVVGILMIVVQVVGMGMGMGVHTLRPFQLHNTHDSSKLDCCVCARAHAHVLACMCEYVYVCIIMVCACMHTGAVSSNTLTTRLDAQAGLGRSFAAYHRPRCHQPG